MTVLTYGGNSAEPEENCVLLGVGQIGRRTGGERRRKEIIKRDRLGGERKRRKVEVERRKEREGK